VDKMKQTKQIPGWQVQLAKLSHVKVLLRAMLEKFLRLRGRSMICRERVRRAIEFESPDRIPHQKRDFWFLFHVPPQTWQPPEGYYPYVHPTVIETRTWRWERRRDTRWLKEDRIAIDEFGTVWKASGRTSLGTVLKAPLEAGWHLLDDYRLPDMRDPSRFQRTAALSQWLGGDRYRIGGDTNSIRERFQYLRGFENAMTDPLLYPEETYKLLSRLTDMTLDMIGASRGLGRTASH
jgi:hypothetical protein